MAQTDADGLLELITVQAWRIGDPGLVLRRSHQRGQPAAEPGPD
jgi:hypothetical protein